MNRLLLIPLVLLLACEDKQEKDCAGVEGGTATVDDCGLCTGGTTGLLPNYLEDCNGVCGGDAEMDNCEVCDNDPTNDCGQDCAGEWGGDAYILTYWYDADSDGLGSGDMYISGNNNEEWSMAKNLGKQINSKGMEFCPFVNNGTLYLQAEEAVLK